MKRILFLVLILAATATARADGTSLPWDTAYIDVQGYINNRADSVTASDHAFI